MEGGNSLVWIPQHRRQLIYLAGGLIMLFKNIYLALAGQADESDAEDRQDHVLEHLGRGFANLGIEHAYGG